MKFKTKVYFKSSNEYISYLLGCEDGIKRGLENITKILNKED